MFVGNLLVGGPKVRRGVSDIDRGGIQSLNRILQSGAKQSRLALTRSMVVLKGLTEQSGSLHLYGTHRIPLEMW